MINRLFRILFLTISVSLSASEVMAYTGGLNGSSAYADDVLPAWFFNPTGPIGVSDPELNEDEALHQAVVRALFMCSISENLNLMSVYELYYHNDMKDDGELSTKQQSHCMAAFNTQLNKYSYEIAEVFYTEYNEAIVMLNMLNNAPDYMLRNADFEGDYLFYFDGAHSPDYGDMLTITMNAPDEYMEKNEWLAKTERSRVWVYSTTDSVQARLLDNGNNYIVGGATTKNALSQNTGHGLWHAISDTYMQALSNFTPRKVLLGSTNMMNTNIYGYKGEMDYRNKVQDMTRLVFKSKVSCKINSISIEKGILKADWSIYEVGCQDKNNIDGSDVYSYETESYQGIVDAEQSKTKNEAKRLALMFAKKELARMSLSNISTLKDNFSLIEEDAFYSKFCDSTQSSTNMILMDVEEITVEGPEIVNGYYHVKMKARVDKNNIRPFIKR